MTQTLNENPPPADSPAAKKVAIAATVLVSALLAALAWQVAAALGSPIYWLAHGGPMRMLALSAATMIPAFILGAWWLLKPGSRAPLMAMAAVGALPIIAILNGSVYRTVVVKSVSAASENLGPVATAIEKRRAQDGANPESIAGMMDGVRGVGVARYYDGKGYFVLATEGFPGEEAGATIFYDSRLGSWRRFHHDRAGSPTAKVFEEGTRGITPREYLLGADGKWAEAAQAKP